MRLFFDPNINPNQLVLSEEESKHMIRVLRLNQGDEVGILDGKGSLYISIIEDPHPKRCTVRIEKIEKAEKEKSLHIAISPTKKMERMEWLIEKATEIGLTRISFIQCQNSERTSLKLERLHKKAVSAMKQSKRKFLPTLDELRTFNEFVEDHPNGLLAHCYSTERNSFSDSYSPEKVILIGPEGDFTSDEIEKASTLGYKFITLGDNRLRSETAALFSCVAAKLITT